MTVKYMRFFWLFCIAFVLIISCNKKAADTSVVDTDKVSDHGTEQPYLMLISLDGFRWDYVDKYKPSHLTKFINEGVKAESLIPSFPSKTFPNHYTIATGLYPDHHGILGNNYYNHEKNSIYSIRKKETVEDGSYYKGSPIWVQAEKAGMVAASYFFVGSEAEIQGHRPTYYYNFDGSVKKEVRVNQAIKWLNMPANERPHLITMYFSDMDGRGHGFGPNNDDVLKEGLFKLDDVLGDLFNRVRATGLPVNIILVSDHGMLEVPKENYMATNMVENDDLYLTIDNGSIVNIHPKDTSMTDSIYTFLKQKEDHFKVYRTQDVPLFEHNVSNPDWGAIQVIPDIGYYFVSQSRIAFINSSSKKIYGQHGFDAELKEMHGIFYGNGPAFKKGYIVPSVKNIHVYPLMCKILNLACPENIDGKLEVLDDVLLDEN